jgi:DNA repair protein RadC
MSNHISIKKLAIDDRPREKLMQHGASVLSDAEILAILIGSGTKEKSAVQVCQEIMKSAENDLNFLAKKSIKELTQQKGIGPAKAITIAAALELGRRRKTLTSKDKPTINSSKIAYAYIKHVFEDLNYEKFYLITLNRANKVKNYFEISSGGISGTVADGKIIFKKALDDSASAIILCHNHPSGNLKPSMEDIKLTNKLSEFGKMIDLPVLDHLIITNNSYYSFADNNQIN